MGMGSQWRTVDIGFRSDMIPSQRWKTNSSDARTSARNDPSNQGRADPHDTWGKPSVSSTRSPRCPETAMAHASSTFIPRHHGYICETLLEPAVRGAKAHEWRQFSGMVRHLFPFIPHDDLQATLEYAFSPGGVAHDHALNLRIAACRAVSAQARHQRTDYDLRRHEMGNDPHLAALLHRQKHAFGAELQAIKRKILIKVAEQSATSEVRRAIARDAIAPVVREILSVWRGDRRPLRATRIAPTRLAA